MRNNLILRRVLIHMQNVAVVAEDEVGDAGDQTAAVRTSDKQNGSIFHGWKGVRDKLVTIIMDWARGGKFRR